jgi:cytochrome d ubiquinol oxidase subunit II
MFEGCDLNAVWFVLVGVLFAGYAILDGFDLGTGVLLMFTKDDRNRRLMLNAVGPVWDGNEVWLITGGGALFAAFPNVYASAFSGFYIAFMLLLLALVFRAVSIEFRSKQSMPWWRQTWDLAFSISSLLASLLIGVAIGNVVVGIPLDAQGNFTGTFWSLLNPYSLLLGCTTVALFTMHGAIYLVLKTEGDLQRRLRRVVRPIMIIFLVLLASHVFATLLAVPHSVASLREKPWLLSIVVLGTVSAGMIPVFLAKHREGWAFLSSCGMMGCLMIMFGASMFPNLLYSQPNSENSLTIYNSASTPLCLSVMTWIAIVGVPLVLAYSAAIYWIFRGKVKLTDGSY